MKTSGPGTFFDGVTSARREAAVELGPDTVHIRTPAGEAMAEWRYADLASFFAPEGVLRVGLAKSPVLARLEIRDAELAAALDERIGTRARDGATTRRTQIRVVAWS